MNQNRRRWFFGLSFLLSMAFSTRGEEISPSSPSGEEVYRLNVGAETWDFTDPRGNRWMKDEAYESLHRWGHVGGQPAESLDPVANTDIPEVYRTHRYGGTEMKFNIEVPPGGYTVRLLFCETYFTQPGQRVFDVAVDGHTVAQNLDVLAAAGGRNRPYAIECSFPVYDGVLDITFPTVSKDNAMISGIEIFSTQFYERDFLSWLSKKMFWYFWNEADPDTGLVSDYANSFTTGRTPKASIATTGMALSIYTIGAQRGWITPALAVERVRKILNTFENRTPEFHGFWYHFLDSATAQRWVTPTERSEVSTVDSALLIMGALQAGEYFRTTAPDIADQADRLYRRMDWTVFTGHGSGDTRRDTFLSMAWSDESGFSPILWDSYSETFFVNLLAFGSPTHAISTAAWTNMDRTWTTTEGINYMQSPNPAALFVHQYHHLWYDLRGVHNDFTDQGIHDDFANYSANSLWATEVNRRTCLNDPLKRYDTNRWGLTAGVRTDGLYWVYGITDHNGTVLPTAAGASIGLTHYHSANYVNILAVLRHLYFQYKHHLWGRHGFTDSIQLSSPHQGTSPTTLGLNNGPMVIALDNQLGGSVQKTFMQNPHVLRGMEAVGFRPYTEPWSFASSVSNNNHARYAVDGSTSTRWESAWSDSQFFTTDFITPKRVNTVTLLWETAHAKQYKIQYSNDAAFWTDALVVTDGNGGQDVVSFPEVTARYFRVLGVERGGVDGTVWGYSLYEASFDDVSLPKTPGTPTLLARSTTSLSWKWVDNATDETEYRVLRSTDDTVLKAGLLPNTESWTQSGLAVNTPQSVRVAAVNPFGTTASEASAIVYTRSAIPANTALTTSSNGTYVLTWTANGNPKGTRYKAYRSTDNKTYTQVYSGTQLHTQVHLVRGVRNYFAVRSLNGNGLASAFGVKVTTIAPKRADFPSETIPDVPFSASLSGAHEPESVIFLDPVEETLPPTPTSWKTTGTPWKISSDEENTLLEITPVGPRTRLARYAEDTQQWDLLPLGSPTPPGVYLSVSLAVENVDGARIGPNPFRPAKGDTEVVLRQLIAGSQVKLISTTGEILWEGLADDTGTLTWDGTNTAGRRVASGVYFVLITKDGDKKTFRLAVEQ